MEKKNIDISQAIFERRSIFPKEFNGKLVPHEVVNDLLHHAQFAPSHKLTYPWFFRVFHAESKNNLFDFWINSQQSEEKKIKLAANRDLVSHVIIITVNLNEINPDKEEICATAAAVQNIHLALGNYPHYGGYWGSGNGIYTENFHQFINTKDNEKCLGYFMLGCVDKKRLLANRQPSALNAEWIK